MVIEPKALHILWPMLLFHQPAQSSYHRLCSRLSYAYTVKAFLTVYTSCFLFSNNIYFLYIVLPSNRQVLQSSKVRPSETTHSFVPLQRFPSTSRSMFLHAYVFTLKTTNSVITCPPSSSFIKPIFYLFSPMGSGLLSCLEYPLVSNLFFTSFAMSL